MEEARNISSMALGQGEEQERCYSESTNREKVHFATVMDIGHLKNAELQPKHQKYKGRVVLRLLEEKPPEGFMWSGVRLTSKQLTSRPDHLWPELWKSTGKNAKLKEKQN